MLFLGAVPRGRPWRQVLHRAARLCRGTCRRQQAGRAQPKIIFSPRKVSDNADGARGQPVSILRESNDTSHRDLSDATLGSAVSPAVPWIRRIPCGALDPPYPLRCLGSAVSPAVPWIRRILCGMLQKKRSRLGPSAVRASASARSRWLVARRHARQTDLPRIDDSVPYFRSLPLVHAFVRSFIQLLFMYPSIYFPSRRRSGGCGTRCCFR